jgi:hypothetical protein
MQTKVLGAAPNLLQLGLLEQSALEHALELGSRWAPPLLWTGSNEFDKKPKLL